MNLFNLKLSSLIQSAWSKLIFCLGLALIISLMLFYFMYILISGTPNLNKKDSQSSIIEFIRNKPQSFLDEKRRRLPKKKEKQKKPPRIKQFTSSVSKPKTTKSLMNIPNLKAALKGMGPNVGMGGGQLGSGATPLVRIEPQYPRKAAMQGMEGWVVLQFDISPAGLTTNIKIIDSQPSNIFNRSAIRALKQWKYRPQIEEGKPIVQKDQMIRLGYTLE